MYDIEGIEFDSERDCTRIDVFQDIKIEFFDGIIQIWQHDGAGEYTHCVCVPAHAVDAFTNAVAKKETAIIKGVEL